MILGNLISAPQHAWLHLLVRNSYQKHPERSALGNTV